MQRVGAAAFRDLQHVAGARAWRWHRSGSGCWRGRSLAPGKKPLIAFAGIDEPSICSLPPSTNAILPESFAPELSTSVPLATVARPLRTPPNSTTSVAAEFDRRLDDGPVDVLEAAVVNGDGGIHAINGLAAAAIDDGVGIRSHPRSPCRRPTPSGTPPWRRKRRSAARRC